MRPTVTVGDAMHPIQAAAEMFITWSIISHFVFKTAVALKVALAVVN